MNRIRRTWNAHTPDYLHPNTKANVIWQLKLVGIMLVFIIGKEAFDEWHERYRRKPYRPLRNTKEEL